MSKTMDIIEQPTIGQVFSINNLPFDVWREEWTVVEFSYPEITFSYTKYWVTDIAYIAISTTYTVAGIVLKETKYGVIIELKNFPYDDVGLALKGDRATYLNSLDLSIALL
jgi:hypothetical protein